MTQKGLHKAIGVVFLLLYAISSFSQNIDSLTQQLTKTEGSEQVKILSDLAWYLRNQNPNKAWNYGLQALNKSQKESLKKEEAQAWNDLGILLYDKSEFDSALTFYNNSLTIREELKDVEGIAAVYNKIGIIHQTRRNINSAIEFAIKALAIYDTLNKPAHQAHCLNNIGVLYFNSKMFAKSKQYHLRALEMRRSIKNNYLVGSSYVNLANLSAQMLDTINTYLYYDSAITVLKQYENSAGYSSALNNYGTYLLLNGKARKALPIIEESLQLRLKNGNKVEITSSEAQLGDCYLKLNMPKKAKPYLFSAKAKATELNLQHHKENIYAFLSTYYEYKNQLDSSMYYLQASYRVKDSILNENLNEKLSEMAVKYEAEKKELQIENLSKENEITALKVEQSETRFLWTLIGFIGLATLAVLAFFQFKSAQKRKHTEALLTEQQKGINAVIVAEENERKRIAKEIHDGIGQQLSGIKLFFGNLKSKLNPDQQETTVELNQFESIIDNVCDDARSISHQMMPKTLVEKGLVEAIDFMLQTSLGKSNVHYSFQHFKISGRYPERIEISLYRICQELVANIIKHANANEVTVQLFYNNKHLILLVEDDGVGFDIDQNNSGIGLLNLRSRVSNLGGNINFESKLNQGTLATTKIPVDEE